MSLLILAALLPLGAFGLFAAVETIEAYQSADEARLRGAARALAAAVDAQLGAFVGGMQVLAASPALDAEDPAEAFRSGAAAASAALGGWVLMLGPGPEHPMLANSRSAPGAALPRSIEDWGRPALEAPLERLFAAGESGLSDAFTGPVIARPMLAALVPVDRPGRPRRALALGFEPEILRPLLAQQGLPPGSFAAILDGQRSILAARTSAEGAQPPGTVAGTPQPPGMVAGTPQPPGMVAGTPLLPGMVAGTPLPRLGAAMLDAQHVYAVERLARAPSWSVVVGEPQAHRRASLWSALRWLVGGALLFGLGMSLAVGGMRREALRDAQREAAALRAGRAQVERLHGGLPVIIFLTEVTPAGEWRRLYLSGDVEAVTGLDREGFDRHVVPDLATPESRRRVEGFYREVLRLGTATVERQIRRGDGATAVLETTARVLETRPDGGALVVGYMLDATSRRDAERRAMASARLASLGEMAAGLAHEVKQPLLSMSLAAELAEMAIRRDDLEEAQRLLGSIVERAVRTAEMIDRLRRFARGAEETAATDDVPLRAAVEGSLAMTQRALADAGVTVEVALGEPPPMVRGQTMLLEQVLSNLLMNARDALAALPVGAPRRIRIAAERREDDVVAVTVADTGGGIAPAILDRLFEPFATTKSPESGTGLGLSISRGLVRAMGGTIDAQNDADGAVFTLMLRVAVGSEPRTLAA